jgi:hypothetical protein
MRPAQVMRKQKNRRGQNAMRATSVPRGVHRPIQSQEREHRATAASTAMKRDPEQGEGGPTSRRALILASVWCWGAACPSTATPGFPTHLLHLLHVLHVRVIAHACRPADVLAARLDPQ